MTLLETEDSVKAEVATLNAFFDYSLDYNPNNHNVIKFIWSNKILNFYRHNENNR